jgi:ribulose-5-phosphate 4-epimerase/fuculose-1-phosphate aldolase
MLERLREEVLEANLAIVRAGLVRFSFGNASGCARDEGLVVGAHVAAERSVLRMVNLVFEGSM